MEVDAVNVQKILSELHDERAYITQAILSLEQLATGRRRRRGRPPKWISDMTRRVRRTPEKQDQHLTSAE